tara:strand:+ start:2773 stop:4644 length:1872 start_codon:yes stop_codon:yes gene_type:complete
MISLIGFLFLIFSVFLSLIIIFINSFSIFKVNLFKFYLITRFATICVLISFLSLMLAYIVSDFSNFNVFQNSHSTKPLIYKITGTWGNHEGSMLMWLTIMSLYTFVFSFSRLNDEKFKQHTIVVQNVLYLIFAIFVIFVSNPFLVNLIEVKEGLGLNPILQDPSLAIHPPLLYIGYVGFSLIFSLSIVGIFQKKINKDWILITKKWTLFCWSMLTAGITLGAYWAYYELGWGGWWFWDPVENLSLMPWITGLALLHSLFMTRGEHALVKWIVFLSILCFSLSIFGTFLVRSGILVSVHTFASDPQRGLFILLVFFLISGFGFLIFLLKTPSNENAINLLFINKTSAIIFNNIIMIIACLTILLGTIYPIVIEVLTGSRISVGGPYFNSTVLPIMLPGFLLMSVAPVLSWQTNKLRKHKIYLVFFLTMSLIVLIVSLFTNFNPWGFIGLIVGIWAILGSLISIFLFYKISFNLNFFKNINAHVAHLGVGIMIIGITVSSVFKYEQNYTLKEGETVAFKDVKIAFADLEVRDKKNFQELRAIFNINKNNKNISSIKAGKNYYFVSNTLTTEAGIFHDWFRDIYIILGEQHNEKWSIKIYNNPLINFIWIGIIIMILSSLVGILKK